MSDFFFFSSRRRHTSSLRDWSSDVCSSDLMRAWGAAGVSMPHYSGAQYSMFPHVPLNAMQPGDLVFWGPGGSQHVGLYIGGGQMIAAPHTGDVVKIQAVWGSPVGAARPR